jgi:hypothetical protein
LEFGSFEVGFSKIGSYEIGFLKRGFFEIGSFEVGCSKTRIVGRNCFQISALEVCAPKVALGGNTHSKQPTRTPRRFWTETTLL